MNVKWTFTERVIHVVSQIPEGEVVSYKQVAQAAGSSSAYRAVGNILNKNRDKTVPCHRVIRSDGSVGGYNGLRGEKRRLIEEEAKGNTKKPT